MFVPPSYNLRSLLVRRSSTALTVLGIGATVAMVCGVLALQQGFSSVYAATGREDIAVFLRPGATSEGTSAFTRENAMTLMKTLPEIAKGEAGEPLAGMEVFLGVRLNRIGGGETNVPIRGVQPATFKLRGEEIRIVEGRSFEPGADEVIVGRRLVERIENCQLGSVLQLNVSPCRVVGIFESDGSFEGEVWGDFERMMSILDRFGPNRVVARLAPEVDVEAFNERLETYKETPATVETEREYLSSQTGFISVALIFLSSVLGLIMGVAAIFTATNTMLSAVAARTHEIGILLATGFRPIPIFLSFLFESLVLGLIGGVVGCVMILPINGIETGTTNFQTFTEVAFAFRVTPTIMVTGVLFSLALGLAGGAIPALLAAIKKPTEALRRS